MSCYIDVCGCSKNDDHNGISKDDCPYCQIDTLIARVTELEQENAALIQAAIRMNDNFNKM